MRSVGRVKEIWRYPAKGMAGETLASSGIDGHGIVGDRHWAVRETSRSEIQSCKRRPELLLCTAHHVGDPALRPVGKIRVRFPEGEEFGSDDPDIQRRLTQLTGVEVTFEPLRPASDADFYRRYNAGGDQWLVDLKATFAREPGEPLPDFSQLPPEMVEFVAAPRGGAGILDSGISGSSAASTRARGPRMQDEHEQETTQEPLAALQGQGGDRRHQGREDAGRAG